MSSPSVRSEQPVLEVSGLSAAAADKYGVDLGDISFDVFGGEIVGIAGVSGNGQAELVALLSGETLHRDRDGDPHRRLCRWPPRPRSPPRPRHGLRAGRAARPRRGAVAFADRERRADRTSPGRRCAAAWSTASAPLLSRAASSRPSTSRPMACAPRRRACPAATCRNSSSAARSRCKPKLLLVSQPTWGVDVGAAAFIRQTLVDLSRAGVAVLIVSEELDELFEICDRLLVICNGSVSRSLARSGNRPRGSRPADDAVATAAPHRTAEAALRFRIEQRPEPSAMMRIAAPIAATALTLLVGAVLFAGLGHDPLATLHAFFIAPLNSLNGLSELSAQGLAADPHRLRTGRRLPRQCLEHRRRRPADHGRDRGDRRRRCSIPTPRARCCCR